MVAVDAGILSLMLHPTAKPPNDPATQKPVEKAHERIEQLLEDMDAAKERIIVPAPALSEFLVLAGNDAPAYLNELALLSNIYVLPFDQRAAIELAAMELGAREKGHKRHPASVSTAWQKVKFDRQIVAIAKLQKAHTLYSDDGDVKSIAEDVGIKVVSTWNLSLPKSKTPLLDDKGGPLDIK
jgi:predicted nucleic acid-binding protein